MVTTPYHLFEAFGIEIEYMLVDIDSLNVAPISDELMRAMAGEFVDHVELGAISWSNELVLHVLELKVSEPLRDLRVARDAFQKSVEQANSLAKQFHARLMPTAMHPWMDPVLEKRLWPHDCSTIYKAFDKIFDCSGHGWSNLQSTHWNLPFSGEQEFAKLHSAIRLLLPLMPALTASSPIYSSQWHGWCDSRLDVYRGNAARVPAVSGLVVPEAVFSEAEYDQQIYQPMFRQIAPLDPAGILQHTWLNSRGAIARFDRGAIEIRILDNQECPFADIALGQMIVNTLKLLVAGEFCSLAEQVKPSTELLADVFLEVSRLGLQANVPVQLGKIFGIDRELSAGDFWHEIVSKLAAFDLKLLTEEQQYIEYILSHGNLSDRIMHRLGGDYSRDSLQGVYSALCECLREGHVFRI